MNRSFYLVYLPTMIAALSLGCAPMGGEREAEGVELDGSSRALLQAREHATCVPVCDAIGTRSEGWYDGCTGELIRWDFCGGCFAYCDRIGTRSEGWRSTCGEDIERARCSSSSISCVARGGVCAATTPGAGPDGWEISSNPWLNCGPRKGLACYVPSCPRLQPPAPSFCPDGVVVPRYDRSRQCITGYKCMK